MSKAPVPDRRAFLEQLAAATTTISLGAALAGCGAAGASLEPSVPAEPTVPVPSPPEPVSPAQPAVVGPYLALGPDEAGFVEALVDVMCPADDLTPSGVECGLALFIDRQLAGAFGAGARMFMRGPWKPGRPELGYQLPLTPLAFFRAGITALDAHVVATKGRPFAQLDVPEANLVLEQVSAGKIESAGVPLKLWFDELVYPLFTQACFADPMYGGNRGRVFWDLMGFPGLPAFYLADVERYRGKPHPAIGRSKSMSDFG